MLTGPPLEGVRPLSCGCSGWRPRWPKHRPSCCKVCVGVAHACRAGLAAASPSSSVPHDAAQVHMQRSPPRLKGRGNDSLAAGAEAITCQAMGCRGSDRRRGKALATECRSRAARVHRPAGRAGEWASSRQLQLQASQGARSPMVLSGFRYVWFAIPWAACSLQGAPHLMRWKSACCCLACNPTASQHRQGFSLRGIQMFRAEGLQLAAWLLCMRRAGRRHLHSRRGICQLGRLQLHRLLQTLQRVLQMSDVHSLPPAAPEESRGHGHGPWAQSLSADAEG